MLVFWQVFQLIFGPMGDGVNVARFIAHEVEIVDRDSYGFGANAKEPPDIDYSLRICSVAMYMLNGADVFIVGSIDGGSGQYRVGQFVLGQANVVCVVHVDPPLMPEERKVRTAVPLINVAWGCVHFEVGLVRRIYS
ncbi:hypothetical protein [Paracoccus sp. (in: a-proteobacteria)]|uniref:hypothetical protein n=1 Tax=Paracoccus sp. TaxID=267 RepID=UPI00391D626F